MAVPLVDIAPTPHLTLVRLIRQAQVAGFKLAEMIPLIAAKNALKTSAPQRTAHAMTYVLLLKVFAAIVGSLFSLWRMIRILRMTEGSIVEGRITYVEGKPGRSGKAFLTFSYSAEGQRFHKAWGETLDASSRRKLLDAVARYNMGDSVPVWHAKADPEVCCIGERIHPLEFIRNWFVQLSEGLTRLFR